MSANLYGQATTQSSSSDIGSFGEGLAILYQNPFVFKLIQVLGAIVVTGLLFFVSKWISGVIRTKITKHFTVRHPESVEKIAGLVSDLVFYAMGFFSLFIGFKIVGVDLDLLMWWLSIGIWFAFREILSNLVAGLMIFTTKEFKIGDIVQVSGKVEHPDDKEILFGRIEEIAIRYVVVRTFDLRRVVVPSLKFISATVKTYTSEDVIRDEVAFTIDIASDIPKTIETVKNAINELSYISKKDYTDVIVASYDSKQIKLKAIYAYDPNAWAINHTVAGAVLQKIVEVLRPSGFKL